MVILDRARRVAGLSWVAVGLVFQLVWLVRAETRPGPVTILLCAVVALLAATTLVHSARGTWLAGWAAAVLIGLEFGGAVADRLGVFGPPGAPGVWWGGWGPFVDYTGRLLPGLGRGLVQGAAVAATVVEVALCGLLLSGWQRRWVGKAAAGLLLVYLLSMARAVGLGAVATYALPILIGGALLVSTTPAHRPGRTERAGVLDTQDARPAGVS